MKSPKVKSKILDDFIDTKFFPEHKDTSHFLKVAEQGMDLFSPIVVTEKLHGTSARTAHTLIKRELSWLERLAKRFGIKVQEEEYGYVVGSRRVVKSINFQGLSGKKHYYADDLWTKVAKRYFENLLNKGEAVYYEIIGKNDGGEIQKGYSYGLGEPKAFIYRITNINAQGIEIDLTWDQVKIRAKELGVLTVPELFNFKKTSDRLDNF